MEARLSLITLGVSDLARARDFYLRLGLPLQSAHSNDQVAFFALSGMWLALYPRELLAQDACIANTPAGFSGVTLAHNLRSKEEVVALMTMAEAAGATITKPSQDTFWGGFSGYFADPDGHLWEIAWNPHFWIE